MIKTELSVRSQFAVVLKSHFRRYFLGIYDMEVAKTHTRASKPFLQKNHAILEHSAIKPIIFFLFFKTWMLIRSYDFKLRFVISKLNIFRIS